MFTPRAFRFDVVAGDARSGDEWIARARRAETLGYATLVIPDNLRYIVAPLPALETAKGSPYAGTKSIVQRC